MLLKQKWHIYITIQLEISNFNNFQLFLVLNFQFNSRSKIIFTWNQSNEANSSPVILLAKCPKVRTQRFLFYSDIFYSIIELIQKRETWRNAHPSFGSQEMHLFTFAQISYCPADLIQWIENFVLFKYYLSWAHCKHIKLCIDLAMQVWTSGCICYVSEANFITLKHSQPMKFISEAFFVSFPSFFISFTPFTSFQIQTNGPFMPQLLTFLLYVNLNLQRELAIWQNRLSCSGI